MGLTEPFCISPALAPPCQGLPNTTHAATLNHSQSAAHPFPPHQAQSSAECSQAMLAATRAHGPASSSTTGGLFSGSTSAQGKQTLFCRGTKEFQHRYSSKQPLNASSTELFMNFKVNHLSREEAKDPRRHASTVLCSKHFSTGQGYTPVRVVLRLLLATPQARPSSPIQITHQKDSARTDTVHLMGCKQIGFKGHRLGSICTHTQKKSWKLFFPTLEIPQLS